MNWFLIAIVAIVILAAIGLRGLVLFSVHRHQERKLDHAMGSPFRQLGFVPASPGHDYQAHLRGNRQIRKTGKARTIMVRNDGGREFAVWWTPTSDDLGSAAKLAFAVRVPRCTAFWVAGDRSWTGGPDARRGDVKKGSGICMRWQTKDAWRQMPPAVPRIIEELRTRLPAGPLYVFPKRSWIAMGGAGWVSFMRDFDHHPSPRELRDVLELVARVDETRGGIAPELQPVTVPAL